MRRNRAVCLRISGFLLGTKLSGIELQEQVNHWRMRKGVLTMTAAAAMLAGGVMISDRAGAVTIGGTDGIRGAVDTVNPVEQAGCYRHGWHGWGWYPFCGRHYGGGYGWDRDGWGGGWRSHRWHRSNRWDDRY